MPLLDGASDLTTNRSALCGTTGAGDLRCDGDRRSLEDDPRRGPIVRTWESLGKLAAFALSEQGSWAITPTGDVWGEGMLFQWPAREPVRIGNVATSPVEDRR